MKCDFLIFFFLFFLAAWSSILVYIKTSELDSEVQVYNLVLPDDIPGQGTEEQ